MNKEDIEKLRLLADNQNDFIKIILNKFKRIIRSNGHRTNIADGALNDGKTYIYIIYCNQCNYQLNVEENLSTNNISIDSFENLNFKCIRNH